MELDKRILPGKRPLTCYDIEEAKKHICRECYFTSKFENFENLSNVPRAFLQNVDDSSTPFQCYGEDGIICYDCFILPCEWVKEEKKLRPFTIEEFQSKFKIGMPIRFRAKKNNSVIPYLLIFNGYIPSLTKEIEIWILMGDIRFSLKELCEHYEWQEHYKEDYEPFGVEE